MATTETLALTVTPNAGGFGAEITGLDISQPLPAADPGPRSRPPSSATAWSGFPTSR